MSILHAVTAHGSDTLRDVLAALRAEEGLGDETDDSKWVWIKLGPIPFAYPNTRGRKSALAAHDLHHALAGYGTGLVGEAELAAWELGSGLSEKSHVRYAIRVFGFLVPWHWSRLRHAFVRGAHCRNLTHAKLDEAMLARSVAEMRAELGLTEPPPEARPEDLRSFRRWAAKGIALVWGPLLPLGLVLWWWLG